MESSARAEPKAGPESAEARGSGDAGAVSAASSSSEMDLVGDRGTGCKQVSEKG